MATFTVGTRDTRAATIAAPVRKTRDKSLMFGLLIFGVSFGLWGIERLLIFSLDRETASYQAKTTEALQQLSPETAQAAEDFYDRAQTIRSAQTDALNGVDALAMLEKTTIPQVRLTSYRQVNDGSVVIKGTTSDYRFVAEQLLRYRSEAAFNEMHVSKSERTDTGQINFEFVVESKPQVSSNTAIEPQG